MYIRVTQSEFFIAIRAVIDNRDNCQTINTKFGGETNWLRVSRRKGGFKPEYWVVKELADILNLKDCRSEKELIVETRVRNLDKEQQLQEFAKKAKEIKNAKIDQALKPMEGWEELL